MTLSVEVLNQHYSAAHMVVALMVDLLTRSASLRFGLVRADE